jgi:D-arabinose 1-dehydrogenase-like Zn-dependent alcohol dehydrogenase
VRVAQASLCATDIKIAEGQTPVQLPRVLGHEMTGWVEAARLRDLPNLCRNGGLMGRDADGGFAEFVAVAESQLHPVPAAIPTCACDPMHIW